MPRTKQHDADFTAPVAISASALVVRNCLIQPLAWTAAT